MEWYYILTIVASFLSLLGLGVVAKFFWTDLHDKKVEQSQEAKEKRKRERHALIVEAVEEVTKPSFKKIDDNFKEIRSRLVISEECDRASLRNGLMGLYYTCAAKGYRTEDDSKNYREMHEAYNKAGGNSFIDSDVSRWFDEISLKPNDYKPPVKKNRKTVKKAKED